MKFIKSLSKKIKNLSEHTLEDELSDGFTIEEIATSHEDFNMRLEAINQCDSLEVLKVIAAGKESKALANAALKRIDDPAILTEVIKTGSYPKMLKQALDRISEKKLLRDIAQNGLHKEIRKKAARKMQKHEIKHTVLAIEVSCPHCSQPVFINGPAQRVKCSWCLSEIELPMKFWRGILEDPFSTGYVSLGYNYGFKNLDLTSGTRQPQCKECGKKLDVKHIKAGADGTVACGSCGFENATFPPPEWLADISRRGRRIVQVFGADREEGELVKPDGLKPIVTSCLQCGGNLLIEFDTPRNATCQYCSTVQYLPDQLWLALHPVKKKHAWFLRWSAVEEKDKQK